MKKLLMVLLVLLMAAPAIAADWNFYGSARVTTFYTGRERSDFNNQDIDLNHTLQGNSRFGANVKADKISGRVELSMRATDGGGGVDSTSGDQTVRTRLLYGDWNFADKSFLRVGKDLSILDMTDVSNRVYGSDDDLTGLAPSANRMSEILLGIGGFRFALVEPTTRNTYAANTATNDAKYPKIEAAYTLPLDMFTFGVGGGWQMVQTTNPVNGQTEDINSYVGMAKVMANIGAFYAKAAGFYGVNINNANWGTGGLGQNTGAYANSGFTGDNRKDATSYGGGGSVGLKFSDSIEFETGGGYRIDDTSVANQSNADWWTVYAQMTYRLAPGFKITPEVGYISNQDVFATGNSGGYDWYAGLQWRLDF